LSEVLVPITTSNGDFVEISDHHTSVYGSVHEELFEVNTLKIASGQVFAQLRCYFEIKFPQWDWRIYLSTI